MPLATEVDAFQGEVGGDQRLVPNARVDDSAIVAHAFNDASARSRPTGRALGLTTNFLDDLKLGEWQAETTIENPDETGKLQGRKSEQHKRIRNVTACIQRVPAAFRLGSVHRQN